MQIPAVALIPARAGSQRVKGKNIRPLAGHPLIAYAIAAAHESGVFARVMVSTESEEIAEIARAYGAEVPFLRPAEMAGSTSPDIEWVRHSLDNIEHEYEAFSILRPTSPFRTAATICRAWEEFKSNPGVDSLRAVELCREHPGKMWITEGNRMRPLLDQPEGEIPWHSRQYQDLPKIYIQNSSLEIAWTLAVKEKNSIAGDVFAPFYTNPWEGFSIDYEDDWERVERTHASGDAVLPAINR